MLERVEKYFGCEGVISHRGRLPQSVDCWQGELLVTYAGELVIVVLLYCYLEHKKQRQQELVHQRKGRSIRERVEDRRG